MLGIILRCRGDIHRLSSCVLLLSRWSFHEDLNRRLMTHVLKGHTHRPVVQRQNALRIGFAASNDVSSVNLL